MPDSSAAAWPGHACTGCAAPCACCSAARSGTEGASRRGPYSEPSSSRRYACSSERARTRFTVMPSGCSCGAGPRRSSSIVRIARPTAITANSPGSVTTMARSHAVRPVRVSEPSDGGQSTRTRS